MKEIRDWYVDQRKKLAYDDPDFKLKVGKLLDEYCIRAKARNWE